MELVPAARIYAQVTATRLRRRALFWVSLALLALPPACAAALVVAGHFGQGLYDSVLEVYFRALLPLVPALLAAPFLAEELEHETFTFVFVRPAPRAALVFGKFVAVAQPVAAVTLGALAATWLLAMIRYPTDLVTTVPHFVRTLVAALLGVFGFTAVATFAGALFPRHPVAAACGYLLFIEAGLGSTPTALNIAALSWHLRNLGDLPVPAVYFFALDIRAWLSALIALAATALFLVIAVGVVSRAEYHGQGR